MDKQINCIANAISKILGTDVEVFKVNAFNSFDEVKGKAFKEMIKASATVVDNMSDSKISIDEKIDSLSIVFRNASIVNEKDINCLDDKERDYYINVLNSASDILNNIITNVKDNIIKMSKEHKVEDKRVNLEELSKEELIEYIHNMK